jgi:glycosyltransferase involved in cell wall biosynthesis
VTPPPPAGRTAGARSPRWSPAHDEAPSIGDAVDALLRAARVARTPLRVIVVADACGDGTAEVARRRGAEVLEIGARSVGAARRAGFELALAGHRSPERLWLATTDADTLVPPTWFARQLRHRAQGAEMVLGTVGVGRASLAEPRRTRWRAAYALGVHRGFHEHVHGANLSMTARAYLALGGFRPLPRDEDVDLCLRAAAAGMRVVRPPTLTVVTSGRLTGRAPGGFAHFLKEIP